MRFQVSSWKSGSTSKQVGSLRIEAGLAQCLEVCGMRGEEPLLDDKARGGIEISDRKTGASGKTQAGQILKESSVTSRL